MSESLEHEMTTRVSGSRIFTGGEYVEWHRGESGTSLIWSSDLPLAELLGAADAVLGAADGDHFGIVDFNDEPSNPVTAEAARALALDSPKSVTFLRIEYASGVALVWSSSPGTQELERSSEFAEASVLFGREQTTLAAEALGAMATRRLAQVADKIAKSVAA
jgi:hypothetical protein